MLVKTGMVTGFRKWPRWGWGVLVCVLAIVPYVRALDYPFISDDYIQIRLGRSLGSPAAWRQLAADPLYRCRSTSLYLTAATERFFGLRPMAYNVSSVTLHATNALLVMLLAGALGFTWPVSVVAAGFFAIYEGHQEAVIWYAALPELLVIGFSLACLICWIRWRHDGGSWRWYAASLGLFIAALLSKESAVAVVPLQFLISLRRRSSGDRPRRHALLAAAPFVCLAGVYAALIFLARDRHGFFFDGTFTLTPGFLIVLPHSLLRMMIFWGALAGVLVGRSATLLFSLGWMAVTLLPYSFLTYMNRVPSRHTYFAAVGLSLLVGAAFVKVWEKWGARRTWLMPALALGMLAHNCLYLWTHKHYQYLERAAPTERLLAHLRLHRLFPGPVWVVHFPYDKHVAYSAVAVATRRNPDSVLLVNEPPSHPNSHVIRWDSATSDFIGN